MKQYRYWILSTLGILLLFVFINNSRAQDFRVVGYMPLYRASEADQIAWEKLTHVCVGFAHPDEYGFVSIDRKRLSRIVTKAKEKNVKVLLSLGGGILEEEQKWRWRTYMQPAFRSTFIKALAEIVDTYQLDGIDMDLEWDRVNEDYSSFVISLREVLTERQKLLTAAFPALTRYEEVSDRALRSFDFINVMCYDFTGPFNPRQPGQHAPYAKADQSIKYWKRQGLSSRKINLGVPFFGWDFIDTQTVKSVSYGQLVARDTNFSELDQIGNIFYNGKHMIQAKTELAKSKVGGLMIWELGQDAFNEYSLLDAIDRVVNKEKYLEQALAEEEEKTEIEELGPVDVNQFLNPDYQFPEFDQFYVIVDNRPPPPSNHIGPVNGEALIDEAYQANPLVKINRMGPRITLHLRLDNHKKAQFSIPNYPSGLYFTLRQLKMHFLE